MPPWTKAAAGGSPRGSTNKRYSFSLFAAALALLAPSVSGQEPRFDYPETRRVDHVDVYHGTEVADPYRWLEQDVRESEEVRQWVEAQNEVTFGYLESIPEREGIRERLTGLWNFEKYSDPIKAGGRYFYEKNDGLQNQPVLYTLDSLDGDARALLDPNEWSEDGTAALSVYRVSKDGAYIAYSVAEAGSDWQTWRIKQIESGRVLDDEIRWAKYSIPVAWTHDSKGFFYSRFPKPGEGEKFQALNLNHKVYYHRLGAPQSEDVLVYERPDHPDWMLTPDAGSEGRYLIITASKGTDEKYRIFYRDLTEPYAAPVELIGNFENEYTFIGSDGPRLFFKTDLEAPRRRLIAIDLRRPEREHWQEIIPESEHALEEVNFAGNLFIATYLEDAKHRVKIYSMDGRFVRDVEWDVMATASGFEGERGDTETFYVLRSFAAPATIYHYDLVRGESTVFREPELPFDPDDYAVKQVFYRSKDGTRVPMFLAHKKGIDPQGVNPTLLYGYGGFNIAITPNYSTRWLAWMEMGGLLAVANLRGGGEYGEEWHRAGTKLQKQNVFDDFIAAAEWLIENGYTSREKLAIQGRSNGGLLVGAVMTQRPDLFGACLPGVGVMDMLRFHKFTAGRFWVDDFGSPENPEEFKALLAYSPYHNLEKGAGYPATLATTADTDDRVVPGHSFKFAARLQYAHAGDDPVLIRIETRAGHGAGKPTSKQIEEAADELAFLVDNLEIELDGKWWEERAAAASE